MTKNSHAARSFLGSLLLLIVALVVFFVVLYPSRKAPVVPVQVTGVQLANESKRHSMRKPPPALTGEGITIRPQGQDDLAPLIDNRAAAEGLGEADPSYNPEVERAITMIDAGNTADAVALLEQILKKDPNNEQALVELAMVYLLDMRQPAVATGYLQRVVAINPENQIVLSELVSLYEEQGKVSEGLGFMSDIFAKNPDSPDLSYGIGQLLTLQGRDSDAIGYYEKATQSASNQIRAYGDLGQAYGRSGDSQRAIESYDKAIAHEEQEVADKVARGLPSQFAEERMNYTKMDKARELIKKGEFDKAQQLIDEVSKIMAGDEPVTALQEALNKKRAG